MRKSRIEAAKTRERIVTAAAAEFASTGSPRPDWRSHEGRRAHARGLSTGILNRRISLSPKPARPQSPR